MKKKKSTQFLPAICLTCALDVNDDLETIKIKIKNQIFLYVISFLSQNFSFNSFC